MGTGALERQFAAIGARVKVVPGRGLGRWIDVKEDGRGEYFELRTAKARDLDLNVVEADRDDRALLLLAREAGQRSKFLCGFDERHWFVAAIPESAKGVGGVRTAKLALQPDAVREAVARVRPRDPFTRRNAAYVRQGEWFFLPRWTVDVDWRHVWRNELLSRGFGKSHVLELAYRIGGTRAMVSSTHPAGITPEAYWRLSAAQRRRGNWREMVRDPELYAMGEVRHPDHNTVVLHGWHRVLMNTEQGARAMRHVAFLD
jgi:hypothetical protein